MGCILSFFKFNSNKSYKVAEIAGEDKSSSNHGRKPSKKQQQPQQHQQQYYASLQQSGQQLGQQSEKPLSKNVLPTTNQPVIYKTVLEATVSDARVNEEESRLRAAEAPGPFEIETDLLSPEVEEAVIKIQANVRGYLTRKMYRGVTPERPIETSQQSSNATSSQKPIESKRETSSSGILAPPPSFSDTPKEFPLDHDDNQIAASQGQKIAEKLIELEKQVSQKAIKPLESSATTTTVNAVDDVIISEKEKREINDSSVGDTKQSPVDLPVDELKSQCEKENELHGEITSSQRPLEIPSIETSGPEEAAIKIQAAFRGYQVRKTISRETSPCHGRSGEDDGVHLREKDANPNQDPERESILVLNQLEECLSQELMRSSIHLGDENSLSSCSTDLDLNASLQSNVSLKALSSVTTSSNDESNSDLKHESIGSSKSTAVIVAAEKHDEKKTIDEELVSDPIKSESINNEQIEGSPKDSQLISNVNQVPEKVPIGDSPENQPKVSPRVETESEAIKTEPVLIVPSGEKVNAVIEKPEIDPVVIVETNEKLDASHVSEPSAQSIDETKSDKETSKFTVETKKDPESVADNKVIESTSSLTKEPTASTERQQSTEEIEEPEIEPLFFDMSSSLSAASDRQIVKEDAESSLKPITSPSADENASLVPLETIKSDKPSDLNLNVDMNTLISAPFQESQKVFKLTKEDSFGSDILILDDEKNDTLYDPFTDDSVQTTSNVQQVIGENEQLTSSSFVDDNLIASVVDDSHKDEGLLLYDDAAGSTADTHETKSRQLTDMNENIDEIKDDILVDLDESDEEDEDSQKRPVENVPTITSNVQQSGEILQSIEQKLNSSSDSVDFGKNELKSLDQSVSHVQQSKCDEEAPTLLSSDVAVSTSHGEEKVPKSLSDLESEKQIQVELAFSPSVQQSTINHDNDSIKEAIDSSAISTNPFLDQPDFDSDIESGKAIPSDHESIDSTINQPESAPMTSTVNQSSQETSQKTEIETIVSKDAEQLEAIKDQQSEILEEPLTISQIKSPTETSDSQATEIKPDDSQDDKSPKKTVEENSESKCQVSLEEPIVVIESEPRVDEQSSPKESSTSSTAINQPAVIIEPSEGAEGGEPKVPIVIESPGNEESEERERDETSPEKSALLLRLQDRETRSKSPNPFNRKPRRKHKKNRNGAN